MTCQYAKADSVAWEQAIADLRIAEAAKVVLEDSDDFDAYEAVADRCDRAKDAVLEQHAPDFEAVIAKLHIFFAEEISSDLEIYDAHKTLIGDLRRLTLAWGPSEQPDD